MKLLMGKPGIKWRAPNVEGRLPLLSNMRRIMQSSRSRHAMEKLLVALFLALVAALPEPACAAGPGYRIVDRIPMSDGWWDYASFDAVHRRLFVARGNGVYKLDVDTGLMDMRVVPGSEGRAVVPLPIDDLVFTTMAGYSVGILFSGEDGKVSKMFELRQASDSSLWEPVGRHVWAMGGHGEVSVLDPVKLEQVAQHRPGRAAGILGHRWPRHRIHQRV